MNNEKPKRKWQWKDNIIHANTKSEARSALKKLFDLERLPVGAKIVEVK